MNNHPAISVCVPTYNGEIYLRDALDSVLAQSWQDFELLIVDDCSQDSTLDIVQDYIAHDSRIRLHRNPRNLGLVGNWNQCTALARGEWIKFLFQDDLLRSDCLESFMFEVDDRDTIAFCLRELLVEEDLAKSGRSFYDEHAKLLKKTFALGERLSPREITEWALTNRFLNVLGEPTAMIFRRHASDEFGLFNDALSMLCDIEFATRIFCTRGVRLINKPLASFRAHSRSTSGAVFEQSQFRNKYLDTIIWLHEMCFGESYAHLRKIIATGTTGINLRSELFIRVQLAGEYIETTAKRSAIEAAEMRQALADTLMRYPDAQPKFTELLLWRFRKIYWSITSNTRNHGR